MLNTTPTKTGTELVGLITALSLRGNSETVALLGGYIYHADPLVAQAAISGLGNIGTQMAVPILAVALESATGERRAVVIDAYLRCAERLFADGDRTKAEQVVSSSLARKGDACCTGRGATGIGENAGLACGGDGGGRVAKSGKDAATTGSGMH